MRATGRPRDATGRDRPVVAIFRSEFLPFSETFIRDHLQGLRCYRPVAVATHRVPGGLTVPAVPLHVLDEPELGDRARNALLRRRGLGETEIRRRHLARILAGHRPAAVHAHFGPDGAFVRPAAKSAGVPLVVTFHGYDVSKHPESLLAAGGSAARMIRDWDRLVADTSAVVTVSQFLKQRLIDRGVDPKKIWVIPCGVDVATFAKSEVPVDGPLVFVGRLVEKKGVSDLLEALAGLSDPPPLRVLGDGPLREDLRAQAERLGVRVSFEGARTSAEVAAAIRGARFVVIPSKTTPDGETEGLPVVALEAQASGRPVVASAHSGLTEAVVDGETGVLVPEGDVAALGRAISALAGDPDRLRRYGDRGHAHVAAHFSTAHTLSELEALYDTIAPDGSVRTRPAQEQTR